MRDRMVMRRVAYGAALVLLGLSLTGCQGFREAAGLAKTSPDEFAVATKAPLIIPPDYNLKPPRPGAAPTNQIGPTASAEAALYGTKPPVTSNKGQLSAGEQQLLGQAGASNANDMIRQKIAADNRAMQASDESFTNQILFGMGSDHSGGTPVDANAEAKRLKNGQTGGATKPADDTTTIQKDDSGWLDGIFDGVF